MRIVMAKDARRKHPDFPFSYDKICVIADKIAIKNHHISHSENINDLVVKVYVDISDEKMNKLIDLLNSEYKEAGFKIWK